MTRLARMQAAMAAAGIDVTILVPGTNMRYLSGIGFSTKLRLACMLVPRTGTAHMVLPTMEAPRAQAAAEFPVTVHPWDDGDGPTTALRAAVTALGGTVRTIAVEHTTMRVFELRAVEAVVPSARIIDADPLIAELRRRHIPVVRSRIGSVLDTDALEQLRILFTALANPGDSRRD